MLISWRVFRVRALCWTVVTRAKVSVGSLMESLLKVRANPQRKLVGPTSACSTKGVEANREPAGNGCCSRLV